MGNQITYREIYSGEEIQVCQMVREGFNEFIAPGYSQEGRNEFLKYVNPGFTRFRLAHDHFILVAVDGDIIAGAIEVRSNYHISLLFVKKEYHQRGVAKKLLELALDKCKKHKPEVSIIEVNLSPYAVPVYEKLGFIKINTEQVANGMRFTPMTLKLK